MGQELMVSMTRAHIHLGTPFYLKHLFMFILKENHNAPCHPFPSPACYQRHSREKGGCPMQVDHRRKLPVLSLPQSVGSFLCCTKVVSRNTEVSKDGEGTHLVKC